MKISTRTAFTRRATRGVCGALLASALVLLPASAATAQNVIYKGADLLATAATGTSFVTFAAEPIPADFFCQGSPPFYGNIRLQGIPLTTSPAGIAGDADTIVRRPANAPFDSYGHARAPIIVVALQLESMYPVTVQCDGGGRVFDLYVCLPKGIEQPITSIDIYKTHADGGFFRGHLAVIADLVFVDRSTGRPLPPITQHIDMSVLNSNRWMHRPGPGGIVVTSWFGVGATCSGQIEIGVPPTTNFFPGWNPDLEDCYSKTVEDEGCHENPGGEHVHCVGTPCSRY